MSKRERHENEEEMEAEFVTGPLDGMRITLHVLHEEPKLTILGCSYERQEKPVAEAEEMAK